MLVQHTTVLEVLPNQDALRECITLKLKPDQAAKQDWYS
jgi:hypothetical protein